jgi:DNA polymerase-3 subunit epsilon
MNFCSIDFETANQKRDSACAIGLVLVRGGVIVEKVSHLIKPPTKEFMFTHIHGLSWRDVEAAKSFGELWPSIAYLFEGNDFMVAHNAPFDLGVLRACLAANNIKEPNVNFRCTLKESKTKWPNLPGYKLSDVSAHLGIDLNHHEALSDALACAKIIIAINKA